ncbi:hypothetical protein PO124_16880 [Bacillus licheniformis]|nr:hypothetical protein [Bacillus licheniformis]
MPIIPAIVASGLLMGLISVLKEFSLGAYGGPLMKCSTFFKLSVCHLPVLIGFSAAKQFGANPF